MTVDEATKVMGYAIICSLMKLPGSEGISFQLYHAITEEWLDGRIDAEGSKTVFEALSNKYGTSLFQQAARVLADKVTMYGDVE